MLSSFTGLFCENRNASVPWKDMSQTGDWFVNMDTWPQSIPICEPWKYLANELVSMWRFWRDRQAAGDVVLEFRNCKADDDRRGQTAHRGKGKGKERAKPYEEVDDEDADIEDRDERIGDDEEQQRDDDRMSEESAEGHVSNMMKIKQEMGEEEELLRSEGKNRPKIVNQTEHRQLVAMHRALFDNWNSKG